MVKVLLGVSGGIAAYKAIEIIRALQQQNVDCQVVLTSSAQQFITPLTLQTISQNEVLLDTFHSSKHNEIEHIKLAQSVDYFIIAPATANVIGKLAHGIADDLLTTMFLASTAKVIVAPAMNTEMWMKPVVKNNIKLLLAAGVQIVEPETGYLACETIGAGRLASIVSIVGSLGLASNTAKLAGKRALVTLGPTIQPIDPFRFISNYSTGKMGIELVSALKSQGAKVTAICGRIDAVPDCDEVVNVNTTAEMASAVAKLAGSFDIVIMNAAISDYETDFKPEKIKGEKLELVFKKAEDIIGNYGKNKKKNQVLVAFAAETKGNKEEILKKLKSKNLDLLVLNLIGQENSGFGSDTNKASLVTKNSWVDLKLKLKSELALDIVNDIIKLST